MSRAEGGFVHREIGIFIALVCLAFGLAGPRTATAAVPDPNVLRVAYLGFPDYLDPQLTYTSEGWTSMYPAYVPLLTYRHASGAAGSEVVPGLAREMPRISNGGRTYTLYLRKGLKYSDGTRVRASDFEYAIKRLLKVHSGGASHYYGIVGAQRFQKTGRGGISGIVTDNQSGRISIHLRRPRGTFIDALALFFAAPVPPSTPMRDQTLNPPPATGPYEINVSFLGWTFSRNPEWAAANGPLMPDLPAGYVDRIEVTIIPSQSAQVKATLTGEIDWMNALPPANRFLDLRRRYGGTQFRAEPTLNVYYFWMNTRRAPFDDLRVRKAVNHAIDRRVLGRIYGGQLAPTQQVLPPGMPGYRKLDLYPYDMRKARRLIAAANPKDRKVTVWTDTEVPHAEAAAYYAAQLRKLGFDARLRVVGGFNYFTAVGRRSTPSLDTGWSNWFADYAHPDNFFRPVLLGSNILRSNNSNFAQLDVPAINQKIEALGSRPLDPARERAYSALDRMVMTRAPWVPYGNLTVSTIVSKRVDLAGVAWNPLIGADLASFRLDH